MKIAPPVMTTETRPAPVPVVTQILTDCAGPTIAFTIRAPADSIFTAPGIATAVTSATSVIHIQAHRGMGSAAIATGASMSKRRAVSILILLIAAILPSCSTERKPATLPNVHPASWTNAESTDFHGKVAAHNGVEGCRACHGDQLEGGEVEISCAECHVAEGLCIKCHGGVDNNSGAPPYGLRGETERSARAVGAHTPHMTATTLADAVECSACHVVPLFMLDSAHLDFGSGKLDSMAEINFSHPVDLDTARWDKTSATCSFIYCHGQFDGGNKTNAPVWNMAGQASCGSCHEVQQNLEKLGWKHDAHVRTFGLLCIDCHASVVDSLLNIVGPALHVNGAADTSILNQALCDNCHGSGPASCTLCHGGKDNATGAPPYSLLGDSLTSIRTVGAHTVHLDGGRLSIGITCGNCHIVPASVGAPGHYDTVYAAEITFGQLAGPTAVYDSAAAACDNVYCHGNFGGGYNTIPIWTGDSSQAACGDCHDVGNNPGDINFKHALHVLDFGLTCWTCHNETVDTGNELKNKSLHINGIPDVDIAAQHICDQCHQPSTAICDQCHGGMNGLPGINLGAPPKGLEGETSSVDLAVGAHTIHLDGNWASNGFACSECHIVPQAVADPGHYGVDSVAELIFGPFAGGASQYNFNNGQCSNVYCHGNFPNGYSFDPIWNASGQAQCGSCHGDENSSADLSGRHEKHIVDKNKHCSDCHSGVVSAGADPSIIGKSLHVSGTIDIVFDNGSGNWDPSTKTCSGNGSGCHDGTKDW